MGSYELGDGCFGDASGGVVGSLTDGRNYPGYLCGKAVG